MTDNETAVTAPSGADPDQGSLSPGAANATPDMEPLEDFRGPNAQMRYEYLACNLRIQQAREAGDAEAERRARADREEIATAFLRKNTRLAQAAATPLMIRSESSAEHLQAALLGLWEAFVGTDPTAVDGVRVDERGRLHPVGGWDPAKGTFATWAGSHISGKVKRSVCSTEGAFTGMSYHTWGNRPKVEAARVKLTNELGHAPSVAQIAAAANVTEATVRACMTAAPSSLDALVSSDSATSLGDIVVLESAPAGPATDKAFEAFASRAHKARGMDLMVLLLREGVLGLEPRSVVQTADRLGIGRGSIGPAQRRARVDMGLPAPAAEPPATPAKVAMATT